MNTGHALTKKSGKFTTLQYNTMAALLAYKKYER